MTAERTEAAEDGLAGLARALAEVSRGYRRRERSRRASAFEILRRARAEGRESSTRRRLRAIGKRRMDLSWFLEDLRVNHVRVYARHVHLARVFLREVPYREVEARCRRAPSFDLVHQVLEQAAEREWRLVDEVFEDVRHPPPPEGFREVLWARWRHNARVWLINNRPTHAPKGDRTNPSSQALRMLQASGSILERRRRLIERLGGADA